MVRTWTTVLIGIFISVFTLNAQEGLEVGIGGGVSHYFGDLNTEYQLNRLGPHATVFGRYNFNERVCLKLSASAGQVDADDAESNNTFERARNLSFRSIIVDGAMQLEFNFLPYFHGSRDEWYTPYIFGGFNLFYYNPQAEYQGEYYNLRELGTEGQFQGEEYSAVDGGFVYGLGFKISMSYKWSINVEFSSRALFTDYLDDVSTTYPDMDELENLNGPVAVALSDRSIPNGIPQIGEEGRQRGNPADNDFYAFLNISIVRYFGDVKCPPITF